MAQIIKVGDKKSLANPEALINNPTVSASGDQSGRGFSVPSAGSYFALTVSTKASALVTAGVPVPVVLFDSKKGYQLNNNVTLNTNLVIAGTTSHYQFMLNDLSDVASYFDTLKLTVSEVSKAAGQFSKPLKVYYTDKSNGTRLIETVYPAKGINEQQYQLQISTFLVNGIIDGRIAFVYEQDADVFMTWEFYQKAEIGRNM